MPTTPNPVYSASSPSLILDMDMSRRIDSDPDFEFFDPNAGDSPGIFVDDFATDPQYFSNIPSPANHKSPLPDQGSLLESKALHNLSAPSTASPGGSSQDSSSESSTHYERKSSSDSSHSLTSGDLMMVDEIDMVDWKTDDQMGGNDMTTFSSFDGTVNPSSMSKDYEFNDKTMEKDFDFDSAASSPSPFAGGALQMTSPEMPLIQHDILKKVAKMPKSSANRHVKMNSQHSVIQSMNGLTTAGSRECSPLSTMITSQESSPTAFFNNSPTPGNNIEFINGQMLGNHHTPNWMGNGRTFSNHGLPFVPPQALHSQSVPRMVPPYQIPDMITQKYQLSIHPIPLKSRVETQIPIKLTLFPLPPGITKLHLPTHTISKPKLLAKPTPERSSDMLELYTTLVCTSAMQNQDNLRRAFERAAVQKELLVKDESSDESGSDDGDERKPLNGGDVNICVGCITRERKRAARKKVKKMEEEESWHKDEAKRVVVFNTHEVKDWQAPTAQPVSDAVGDRPEPFVRDGSLQVDAPMRIACYCRHQNEKLGFQVIFTIKDYRDNLVAQAITSSIMITDDHKTHNMPTLSTHNSNGSDTPVYSGSGPFQASTEFASATGTNRPFRLSQSTSDLQNLQQSYNMQFQSPVSQPPSTTTSTSMTPRNMSRQTSPAASLGPVSKKRKASGSSKVPSGLAMTRLETGEPSISHGASTSASSSAMPSPYTPSLSNFPTSIDLQFGQSNTNHNLPLQLHTGPPTPNSNDQTMFSNVNRSHSMENLAMQPIYSTPNSAIPSRTSSPTGTRNAMQAYQQQQQQHQLVQAVNGMYSMPMAMNTQRPPTIHKMIPNEGPKAGGIEVTCLGSGFFQGLEVMFGDCRATTTTFWGETSLVCLLPPSAFAGTVAVTFKHQHQLQHMSSYPTPPVPKQPQTYFKYIDDDEQQIIRTALAVLGHKMTGKMEDVRDLARRIVGDGPSSWGATSPNGGQNQQGSGSGFSAATFGVDVEATLLRCLDLIDLDDSPNMPRLNLRRASGQTMLHLACSLGLHRFVAALLARGANPEPRDKGGFTPMHFAALHGHPQIVRRLMLSGADPSVRSLQGFTPSDMATSEDVLRTTRRVEHHSRTRSGGSLRSRTSSATSLRSVWESASTPAPQDEDTSCDEDEAGDHEYEDEDADAAHDSVFWMRASSRRPSSQLPTSKEEEEGTTVSLIPLPPNIESSPMAGMLAFRDQLSGQIAQLQQTMQLNLPQMPQFNMGTLPDYQAYLQTTPMVRRISNLVGSNRPGSPTNKEQGLEHRWWDLFSNTVPSPPPAYEDIFPAETDAGNDLDTKRTSAEQAAADALADQKCAMTFDQTETGAQAESSTTIAKKKTVKLDRVRIGQNCLVTREQQDQLRLAHAERVKRLRADQNLFFIWIPLLLIIVLAMLYNRVPAFYNVVTDIANLIRYRSMPRRFVEVQ